MRIHFNKFERVTGVFILAAVVAAVAMTVVSAVEQGWFASKVVYKTKSPSADGLYKGTKIHISGLIAGEVTRVELLASNEVFVEMEILAKYIGNIREDSHAQVVRPFILGEKVIEVTVGSEDSKRLAAGSNIPMSESYDVMDLLSGKKLGPFLQSMEGLMSNLGTLAEAFADPKRTKAFIRMFDKVEPLIRNLNKMSFQVTKLTKEMNHVVPELRKASPEVGTHVAQLIQRLDHLTKTITPAVDEIGGDLPRVTRRAVEALDEMVITLKSMQKSFFLSGKAEDVREEEAARRKKRMKQREPATK